MASYGIQRKATVSFGNNSITIGPRIIPISIIRTHAYVNSAPYYFKYKNTAVDYNYMLTSSERNYQTTAYDCIQRHWTKRLCILIY